MQLTLKPSRTEEATDAFLERVGQIPEVIGTKRLAGKTPCEAQIVVFVPTLLSETTEQVIALRAKVRRTYPDVDLEVSIKGLRERGLNPATVTSSELAEL